MFFLLRDQDQWSACHFFWKVTKATPIALYWELLQANRPVNKQMRGYTRPKNDDFRCFLLRDQDQWPVGHFFWRVTQGTRIVLNLRTFASKSTGKRKKEMEHLAQNSWFSCFFLLRDQDQWQVGHVFWRVTQATRIALNLRSFASKWTSKRKNERVHQAQNCLFSWFYAPWPRPMTGWSLFLKSDASHSDCA